MGNSNVSFPVLLERSIQWRETPSVEKRYRTVLYHGRRWQVHVASAFPLDPTLPGCVLLRAIENILLDWGTRGVIRCMGKKIQAFSST